MTRAEASTNLERLDAAYIASHAAVIRYLDEIRSRIHDLPAPESDELNWAHLGSMAKVEQDLQEIVAFLGNYQESGD